MIESAASIKCRTRFLSFAPRRSDGCGDNERNLMQSQDSVDLCRVGPGTVMGEFMRQYWVPAAVSKEVTADGDPMRLMILGEKLIAFRDTQGRVGIFDH